MLEAHSSYHVQAGNTKERQQGRHSVNSCVDLEHSNKHAWETVSVADTTNTSETPTTPARTAKSTNNATNNEAGQSQVNPSSELCTCPTCDKTVREDTAHGDGEDTICCDGNMPVLDAGITKTEFIKLGQNADTPFHCLRCCVHAQE